MGTHTSPAEWSLVPRPLVQHEPLQNGPPAPGGPRRAGRGGRGGRGGGGPVGLAAPHRVQCDAAGGRGPPRQRGSSLEGGVGGRGRVPARHSTTWCGSPYSTRLRLVRSHSGPRGCDWSVSLSLEVPGDSSGRERQELVTPEAPGAGTGASPGPAQGQPRSGGDRQRPCAQRCGVDAAAHPSQPGPPRPEGGPHRTGPARLQGQLPTPHAPAPSAARIRKLLPAQVPSCHQPAATTGRRAGPRRRPSCPVLRAGASATGQPWWPRWRGGKLPAPRSGDPGAAAPSGHLLTPTHSLAHARPHPSARSHTRTCLWELHPGPRDF